MSVPVEINDRGDVAGTVTIGGRSRPVIWRDSEPTVIVPPSGADAWTDLPAPPGVTGGRAVLGVVVDGGQNVLRVVVWTVS
jgi:hypothetical protein